MRKYTKTDGKLPHTDFKQGDVVVYEGEGQKDIIVVDDIYEARHGDIFFKTILVKADGEQPYLKHLQDVDYRNWFIGDTLRDATADEIKELLDWLLPFVPEGLMVDSYNYRKTAIELQERLRAEKPVLESKEIDIAELERCRVRLGSNDSNSEENSSEDSSQIDDFVAQIVEETKRFFKHDRKKADVVRQIMLKVGRTDADQELDEWIEGRETVKRTIGQLVVEQNNYGVQPSLTADDNNTPKLPDK
ncbi:MAG: hypothetical protein IJ868_06355 [Prevotella sp.]|nr:hypothetical protein [Prevotella sp.]